MVVVVVNSIVLYGVYPCLPKLVQWAKQCIDDDTTYFMGIHLTPT